MENRWPYALKDEVRGIDRVPVWDEVNQTTVSVTVNNLLASIADIAAEGVEGPAGPTGPQGPAGPTGATGATGAAGANGANGATGPQGPAGDTGATGPAGADGDDGVGVPAGGTTGQVLAKASGTDFDTEWVNQTGGSGISDGDKGDITVSGTGATWTIDAAAVTLAKMANLAQDQFIGRVTASTGAPETATITSAARTVLDDTTVAAMVNTLGGATSSGTGGLVRATSPTLVTPVLGTPTSGTLTNCTGLTTAGIIDDAVTNAKLANVATSTIKGRVTASTGDPEDLTATQVRTLLNVADGATANSADATLLARANHTGTQAASTISDFNAESRAQTEAALIAGANVTITPGSSGATRTLTIAASGGGGGAVDSVNGQTGVVVLDASDVGALGEADFPTVTATKPVPVGADRLMMFDSAAGFAPVLVTKDQLEATFTPPVPEDPAPLLPWDWWYNSRIGNNNVAANDVFLGAVISSGTNSTAIPAGGLDGFNSHGVFLRSSTTANGGYRYQTSSLVSDYFGTISHKFRFQFLWRTAFTGRMVRAGFHDSSTSADAVDGAYFEIDGDTCRAKTANNSTRTTDATTITLSLDAAYTFDIEVNAAGTAARFRVYSGNSNTTLMDVTITTNIPTSSARAFGAGVVATESSATASDIGILYSLGIGTVEGFTAQNVTQVIGDIEALLEDLL